MSRSPRTSRRMLLAAPMLLLQSAPFPVSDIAVRADVHNAEQEVHGTIGTAVSTPFGAMPVSGRVRLAHGCDGAFTGTVRYAFLVRLGARLKGISLVTAMDGRVPPMAMADCAIVATHLAGQFRISDSTVTGSVRTAADSMAIHGTIRAVGDTAYHVLLSPVASEPPDTTFVNLYAR